MPVLQKWFPCLPERLSRRVVEKKCGGRLADLEVFSEKCRIRCRTSNCWSSGLSKRSVEKSG